MVGASSWCVCVYKWLQQTLQVSKASKTGSAEGANNDTTGWSIAWSEPRVMNQLDRHQAPQPQTPPLVSLFRFACQTTDSSPQSTHSQYYFLQSKPQPYKERNKNTMASQAPPTQDEIDAKRAELAQSKGRIRKMKKEGKPKVSMCVRVCVSLSLSVSLPPAPPFHLWL